MHKNKTTYNFRNCFTLFCLADWDRCKRRCPVLKPKPPTVDEAAQLIMKNTDSSVDVSWQN